ncbi:hypothetical protein F5Y01DRAFT_322793 [Xylaria sp. FL0043]|nr:hypothetical protein F5Y01DRAFT_322793 [Xylaria sp. FL0043]
MPKFFLRLSLSAVLLSVLLRKAFCVTVDQLFVVQSGASNGGCDKYFDQVKKDGILDNWVEEINFSLSTAIDGLDLYNQDIRIRRAVQTFFGVRNRGKASNNAQQAIDKIADNLKHVQDFVSYASSAGQPIYQNSNFHLFCGSDFLVRQAVDTPALDWQAKQILDNKGNPVNIAAVPEYAAALAGEPDKEAWWSGDHTPVNGYYFSNTGGEYCDTKSSTNNDADGHNLGLTAVIQQLGVVGSTGAARTVDNIIICDYSFTNPDRPESYAAGDAAIVAGTNLAKAVPRSATLFHELFHLLFGVDNGADPQNPTGFLEGDEIYDLAQCIETARKDGLKAQRNPESYVFFVTHMFYLLGVSGDGITKNWDFKLQQQGSKRIYSATTP